jgi:hypothetical protein
MGEQPPRDGDDIWSDVLEQVAQALGDVNLGEGGTRDALIDGVRQALDGLDSTIDLDIEVVTDGSTEPQVSIVEGGRSDADPITPGEKPDLRVADLPEDGSTDDVELDALRAARKVFSKVKVLRMPGRAVQDAIPGLGQAGWIQVSGGGDTIAAWQTVYQGTRARLYRVGCTQGSLDIILDGAAVQRLSAGQSIDIEGCLVRVSAVDETSGRGGYAWVDAPEGEE